MVVGTRRGGTARPRSRPSRGVVFRLRGWAQRVRQRSVRPAGPLASDVGGVTASTVSALVLWRPDVLRDSFVDAVLQWRWSGGPGLLQGLLDLRSLHDAGRGQCETVEPSNVAQTAEGGQRRTASRTSAG